MFKKIGRALDKLSDEIGIDKTELFERIVFEDDKIKLNLNRLNLTFIPHSLINFPNLTELNLSNNSISEIPDTLCDLNDIRVLNLGQNQLTLVNYNLDKLINLVYLNLEKNQIVNLPSSLEVLSNLEVLKANNNKIKDLQPELVNLINLEILELQHNLLTVIPPFLDNLLSLKKINLCGNLIEEIKMNFSRFDVLEELNLNENKIKHIPNEIVELPNIISITLQSNPLVQLPNIYPSSLKKLDIRNIKVKNIPVGILDIEGVKCDFGEKFINYYKGIINIFYKEFFLEMNLLNVDNNREHILNNLTLDERGFESIDLSGLDLVVLPISIFQLDSLRGINLSKNKIKSVPNDLIKLKKLTDLDLSRNELERFAIDLHKLRAIQNLDLSYNYINQSLRSSKYCFIKTINMKANKISKVEIENFVDLNYLNLAFNPIANFSRSLGKARALKELVLSIDSAKILEKDYPFIQREMAHKVIIDDSL